MKVTISLSKFIRKEDYRHFSIVDVAMLRYFRILAISPRLYGDGDTYYTDSHHTVWHKSPKSQNTSTLQKQVGEGTKSKFC